jgi:hypothetical protein
LSTFISYAQEGEPRDTAVLRLADDLRANGIETDLDRYHSHPKQGWYKWMEQGLEKASHVLVLPSKVYGRKFLNEGQSASGGAYEGALISAKLFESGVDFSQVGIVMMSGEDKSFIPAILKGCQRYSMPDDFEALLRWLSGQPRIVAAPLGNIPSLPANRNSGNPANFDELCNAIMPILQENSQLFGSFGPNSGTSNKAEIRWDMGLWEDAKARRILPNNSYLLSLITSNLNTVPVQYRRVFDQLIAHLQAFIAHSSDPKIDYRQNQFPFEITAIVTKYAAQKPVF